MCEIPGAALGLGLLLHSGLLRSAILRSQLRSSYAVILPPPSDQLYEFLISSSSYSVSMLGLSLISGLMYVHL
jgi:hypothetical protein